MTNKELGQKFAKNFNKKYGIITYSGTLAIEVALNTLEKGSKVLVSSKVCYSIVNTIIKLDLTPVLVTPSNGLYFINKDIEAALDKQHIDCILLVHQYGILNNINLKKYKEMNIKIIEDVAQSWDIGEKEYKVGIYSDIVITSFGKTKPLSYGIGGGLFFNDKSIFDSIDYYDNESREKESILLSYSYPLCENIDYKELIRLADNIVDEQRKNAKKYYVFFKNYSGINCLDYDNKNVWHRFPIWIDNDDMYKKLIRNLEKYELEYQLPHKINLIDLKRNKNCPIFNNQKKKKNIILLRTRNININRQLKFFQRIMDKF